MLYFPKYTGHCLRLLLNPSRSTAKSESCNRHNLQCSSVFPTWQYCWKSFVWWKQEINFANRLSHTRVHFVTDLSSLLTDHRMSRRPISAKYKHFKTICERTSHSSPSDSSSSWLNWWSSRPGFETWYSYSTSLFASSHDLSTHFWACPSMS